MITIVVLLFILATILFLWQISNFISVLNGSPYVMADRKIVYGTFRKIKLKKGDQFYDLGCGRGDVLIEAEKFGAKCTGIEISPYYYIYARLKTWGKKNISVKYQNINTVDLSKANIVYCYLLPKFLERLAPKFKKEMKKGSKLISIGFRIAGLKVSKELIIHNREVFLYSF